MITLCFAVMELQSGTKFALNAWFKYNILVPQTQKW